MFRTLHPHPNKLKYPLKPHRKKISGSTHHMKTPDISEDHTEFYIDNGVQRQIKISLLISIITLTT